MRFLAVGFSLAVLAAGSACGQSVISTHSGVIHYIEGRAYLGDQAVEPKFGQFPEIKENQEFRTEEGRAEILLTPGVFLRLGENSAIRMLSTSLTDTRVEVLAGSAIVESSEIPKDNAIGLVYKNDSVRLLKQGLYRLDTEPARFQVYEGEAVVTDPSGQLTVKGGKQTKLSGVLMAESFDRKPEDQDALYSWSDRRASYVAQANMASASAAANGSSGSGYSGIGGGLGYSGFGYYNAAFLGGWAFNPIFGMYTYLPYGGFGYSPFGYTYFSPVTVVYAPTYGGNGYGGPSRIAAIGSGNRITSVATHRGAASSLSTGVRSFGGGRTSFGGGGGRTSFGGGGGHASFGGGGGGHSSGGGRR